jgi:hypothetical protein
MKRLIELKRLFKGKRILGPVKLKGNCERVYRFPHDIWWIISQYLETYSLIKLEKTCKHEIQNCVQFLQDSGDMSKAVLAYPVGRQIGLKDLKTT